MLAPPRIGRVFGRLTVLSKEYDSPSNDGNNAYLCQCECGKTATARWHALRKGQKKSCGCLQAENLAVLRAQGDERRKKEKAAKEAWASRPRADYHHPLYTTYRHMLDRCYNEKAHNFRYYGARGIAVCGRWKEDFWAFVDDMGERPEGHTLDRIDVNGNYEPSNCRWADNITQKSNIRNVGGPYIATIRGMTKFVAEWARDKGASEEAMKKDIRAGVRPEVAVVAAVFRKKLWGKNGFVTQRDCAESLAKAEAWLTANP